MVNNVSWDDDDTIPFIKAEGLHIEMRPRFDGVPCTPQNVSSPSCAKQVVITLMSHDFEMISIKQNKGWIKGGREIQLATRAPEPGNYQGRINPWGSKYKKYNRIKSAYYCYADGSHIYFWWTLGRGNSLKARG